MFLRGHSENFPYSIHPIFCCVKRIRDHANSLTRRLRFFCKSLPTFIRTYLKRLTFVFVSVSRMINTTFQLYSVPVLSGNISTTIDEARKLIFRQMLYNFEGDILCRYLFYAGITLKSRVKVTLVFFKWELYSFLFHIFITDVEALVIYIFCINPYPDINS